MKSPAPSLNCSHRIRHWLPSAQPCQLSLRIPRTTLSAAALAGYPGTPAALLVYFCQNETLRCSGVPRLTRTKACNRRRRRVGTGSVGERTERMHRLCQLGVAISGRTSCRRRVRRWRRCWPPGPASSFRTPRARTPLPLVVCITVTVLRQLQRARAEFVTTSRTAETPRVVIAATSASCGSAAASVHMHSGLIISICPIVIGARPAWTASSF